MEGVNVIKFTLTPVDGTKGQTQTVQSKSHDGFDGYIDFSNKPYGNYLLEEVTPPERVCKKLRQLKFQLL
ncbi:MAG: prealbumin-like fold domain-containing protein [Streptococcaceae bacterium]|jgi:hypothetical protein|nr:prealbumin-like fold domain-containing protein [Streptococcaceae bacterium]